MTDRIKESDWYDEPALYDLAFRGDTALEAKFLAAAWRRYGSLEVRRMLEVGCGTGRVALALARRTGAKLVAFDAKEAPLAFLRRRAQRFGIPGEIFQANMEDFQLQEPVDAAFNLCNTFRHLLTEEAALAHLDSVAAALREGGTFVLALHLLPPDASLESCERWRERSGKTEVCVTFRVLKARPRERLEDIRVNLLARRPKGTLRLRSDFTLRTYSPRQFRRLLSSVPQFELLDVFDFWYDIEEPLKLDDRISDTVVVLRRTNVPARRKLAP